MTATITKKKILKGSHNGGAPVGSINLEDMGVGKQIFDKLKSNKAVY
jgi:hypothetical protein